MNEKKFVGILVTELKKETICNNYQVAIGEKLIYKVMINKNIDYSPQNPKTPSVKSFAFETDIMIHKDGVPLVVIEVKKDDLTTHDIITYSKKAKMHKEIYPYLRYGLVVGGFTSIVPRFHIHNENFDFALIVNAQDSNKQQIEEYDMTLLTSVIRDQLENAELLMKITSSIIPEDKVEYLKCISTKLKYITADEAKQQIDINNKNLEDL